MIFVSSVNSNYMLNKYHKENTGIDFNSEFIFNINIDQENTALESSSEIETEECIFQGFDGNYQAFNFLCRIHRAFELHSFRKFIQAKTNLSRTEEEQILILMITIAMFRGETELF